MPLAPLALLLALGLRQASDDPPPPAGPSELAGARENTWEPGQPARWLEGGLWRNQLRPRPGSPGDVLVVVLDDIGFSDATSTAMPNLHALAARGVVYVNAYANPTCSPSRRALLSGRWWTAESGDVCAPATGLQPAIGELQLAFSFPGPAALIGKWHVGAHPTGGPWQGAPAAHGFATWRGTPSNLKDCGGTTYTRWTHTDGAIAFLDTRYQPPVVRDELLAEIGASDGPRLLVWTPALAHGPWHFPPASELPPGWPTFGFGERMRFEAMCASVDLHLGQVLAALDDDWLVIVVSDNGTPKEVSHTGRGKTETWREGVHVPFVVAGPGVPQGFLARRLVHVADVLPTVLHHVGAPIPPGLDGLSLYPSAKHDYVLVGRTVAPPHDVAAVSLTQKLRRVDGVESFYDLVADYGEQVDRIADPAYASDVAAARAWLDANLPP